MEDSLQSAYQYLLQHSVLCLSTCVENESWVAPVFYSVINTQIVFLSAPHTRHCKNIALNPKVSASIQEDCKDWAEIKGIQLQGTVSRIEDEAIPAVISAYAEKFPIIGSEAPKEIRSALNKVGWFELTVEQLYFIDNSKGFGHRTELSPKDLFAL